METRNDCLKALYNRHRTPGKNAMTVRREVRLFAERKGWPDIIVAVNRATSEDERRDLRAATQEG